MNDEARIIRVIVALAMAVASSCSEPEESRSMQKSISPSANNFASPEDAVVSLIHAYQSLDVDSIVAAKDFELDSRLFWEDLGLPVTDAQSVESISAFETNFRTQLEEEGIPDYRSAEFSILRREDHQSNFVVVVVEFQWPDGKTTELQIPTVEQDQTWKVVLAPGYDHL